MHVRKRSFCRIPGFYWHNRMPEHWIKVRGKMCFVCSGWQWKNGKSWLFHRLCPYWHLPSHCVYIYTLYMLQFMYVNIHGCCRLFDVDRISNQPNGSITKLYYSQRSQCKPFQCIHFCYLAICSINWRAWH